MDSIFPEYTMAKAAREAIIQDCLEIFGNNVTVDDYNKGHKQYKEELEKKSDYDLLKYYIKWLGYDE